MEVICLDSDDDEPAPTAPAGGTRAAKREPEPVVFDLTESQEEVEPVFASPPPKRARRAAHDDDDIMIVGSTSGGAAGGGAGPSSGRSGFVDLSNVAASPRPTEREVRV